MTKKQNDNDKKTLPAHSFNTNICIYINISFAAKLI